MSTTFQLLPYGGDETIPSIDITESSMQFDITAWTDQATFDEVGCIEFENLTAREVCDVALKMLQVVLYSYPELHTELLERLRTLPH